MASTNIGKNIAKSIKKPVKTVKKVLSKTKTSPIKRSTVGFEVELFILDKNGKVVNEADKLLKKIEEKKRNTNSDIVKEHGMNQIEVNSYPSLESINTMKALLDNIKLLLYTAEEEGLVICPLAMYPGKYTPEMRGGRYKAQEKLFGEKRFKLSPQTVGYHCHYELPWGVFDKEKLRIKQLVNSKNKDSLLHVYNFLIAADPALTAFTQSSPFFQGKHLAKDCRLVIIRGGEGVDYPDGLYGELPDFGQLPSYAHTGTDIIDKIESRHQTWLKLLKESGVKDADIPKYKSVLDTNWTPVKVNAHGTMEQRGMDMNHILIILAITELIRIILQNIQEKYINVVSSDAAIKEPFRFEKNTIYIPPDSHVRNVLQKNSAYKGFGNEEVWYYAKRLLWLAKILSKKDNIEVLEPLEKMIQDKKTVSDEILAEAKKLGHTDLSKDLPADIASKIALNHSQRLFQEIVLAEKYINQGH